MSQSFRDFDSEVSRSKPAKPPVTFKFGGQHFTAVGNPPYAVIDDVIAGVKVDDTGNRIYAVPSLKRFVLAVLVQTRDITADEALAEGIGRDSTLNPIEPGSHTVTVPADDADRFQQLGYIQSKDAADYEMLGELAMWLLEQYGQRPTGRPAV